MLVWSILLCNRDIIDRIIKALRDIELVGVEHLLTTFRTSPVLTVAILLLDSQNETDINQKAIVIDMREDPTPYIRESEDKINKPAVCTESDAEISLSNGDMVYLGPDFQPLADEFKSEAEYLASVQSAGGYPWNGIHPDTGETQALDSASWWKLQDIKEL